MRRNGIAGLACAIALAAFAAPSALAQDPPDTQGPEITIAAPGEGHDYGVGEQVTALYVCSDPSGVAECTGTAPAGQPIDTATTGPHTFTAYAPLAADPLTLLTYGDPISNDPVALEFKQPIAATDPLRTGTYAKTLVFTLSTTSP